jgi:hypothetical protein
MTKNVSKIQSHIAARSLKRFDSFDSKDHDKLGKIGIDVAQIVGTMDALDPTYTAGTANTPIQFLQNWLPGFVKNLTTARKIDELLGITTLGSWEDEQIVQPTMERTGNPVPYGDFSEVPYSSYNFGFETRTIVRFEEGMIVTVLDEKRIAKMNGNDAQWKREASALALEIIRNSVGFNGYNDGVNKTYGLLNDPNLNAYVNLPNGASLASEWSTKTYLEITADIRGAMQDLRTQSGDNIDPTTSKLTLAIASSSVDYLSVTSDFGNSVQDWLDKTYPNVRVVSTPDFDAANGGDNVFYLYAEGEGVSDSTDGGEAIIQLVPNKFMTVGVQQTAKGRIEDYSNALAGVLVKRPFLIVRRSGC